MNSFNYQNYTERWSTEQKGLCGGASESATAGEGTANNCSHHTPSITSFPLLSIRLVLKFNIQRITVSTENTNKQTNHETSRSPKSLSMILCLFLQNPSLFFSTLLYVLGGSPVQTTSTISRSSGFLLGLVNKREYQKYKEW